MTDKAEERAREVLMIFYQEGYREGQANPSPACSACGVYKGPVCGCDKQPGEVTGTEDEATTLPPAAVARVLRETLPFFRSVIQGREFWTATCEQAYKRAMSEVSDTEENPTKHEYRRCPMCGRCAECGEENPTDD